jgi:ribosomal-protein-alanine N-acetyltransferase
MAFPLTSERLLLRPFELSDAPAVHRIYSDERVMRWVGTGPVVRPEQTEAMLTGYIRHQQRFGFSFWALLERSSGELIGDAGLYTRAGQVELGYTLARAHWGNGYATEAAGLCVREAFTALDLPHLDALIRPENPASLAVLRKLGFEERGQEIMHGAPHILFRLVNPAASESPAGDDAKPAQPGA